MTHRDELTAEIDEVFGVLEVGEVERRCDDARIAHARRNSVADLAEHPRPRNRWTEVGSPVGPLAALVPPVATSGVTPRMDPVPEVGEHTDAVLAALGYSPERITELRAEHVL